MPSWILISENDTLIFAPGFMVFAMVWMNGVQLLSPSAELNDADMRPQHHDVRYFEALEKRQQPQVRGQDVDRQRRVGVAAAAPQADVMERDVAGGEHGNVDGAVE